VFGRQKDDSLKSFRPLEAGLPWEISGTAGLLLASRQTTGRRFILHEGYRSKAMMRHGLPRIAATAALVEFIFARGSAKNVPDFSTMHGSAEADAAQLLGSAF
jgi:hypothetical protein